MRPIPLVLGTAAVLAVLGPRALAQDRDPFEFFSTEAKVITASLEPRSLRQAPATVYVLTSADIKASGAQTLWDALRSVPGVDVIATRALYGEVSIRGLDKPLNNRTLVLLDGRTVLNGFFDFVNWGAIPVTVEEIDRIEVVEGPASALFGANAINGVINIITKAPEQLSAGLVSCTPGDKESRIGTALFAGGKDKATYRTSLRWSTANGFEDTKALASEVGSASGILRYQISQRSSFSLSGGVSNLNTQLSGGVIGTAYEDGTIGFARGDYAYGGFRARAFWNRGRTVARGLYAYQDPNLHYDTQDVNVEQTLPGPGTNSLVVGGGFRQNSMRSQIFEPGVHRQSLWAMFFEDHWSPRPPVDIVVSGRLDRHPLAGAIFSPRGSVSFQASKDQSFRISVGSAFRNPTLTENYLDFTTTTPNPGTDIPNPPYSSIELTIRGNRDLGPERLLQMEVAHLGTFGILQTKLAGFHYRLRDIVTTATTQSGGSPPTFQIEQSFTNAGTVTASGGEASAEVRLHENANLFANYSYQSLENDEDAGGIAQQSPRHKANLGIRWRSADLTVSTLAHWVSETAWQRSLTPGDYATVPGYVLLNLGVSYYLPREMRGAQLRLGAFNATNNRHHEILPAASPVEPGQFGEVIGRRVSATLACSF